MAARLQLPSSISASLASQLRLASRNSRRVYLTTRSLSTAPQLPSHRSARRATHSKPSMASTQSTYFTMAQPGHSMKTSGTTDAVWIHEDPYENRPHFTPLDKDIETQVCIIGAGIAGISTAYELVLKGVDVVLIDARDVLSGETGRTSGHLSYSLDASYPEIAKKHGEAGARIAAESNIWAIRHIGEVAKKLEIDCEYRLLANYEISQYQRGEKGYDEDMKEVKEDTEKLAHFGLPVSFDPEAKIKGWNGDVDQRGAGVHREQAGFHPTKYLNGVLKWLAQQPNFRCYTRTRMHNVDEGGILSGRKVKVSTKGGNKIKCDDAVEATNIPLQKLSIVAQCEYYRTYCIAIRVPKGSVEDCLINDQGDPYIYVRLTPADQKDDYLIVGGQDHKVGQEPVDDRYVHLEEWTRARFPQATSVDYKWSGQVQDSIDLVSFIGRNQGCKHTWVVSGDTGHGLTNGVIASRILADELTGVSNPWASLYNPTRFPPLSTLPSMLSHDLQVNAQYKKFATSEIPDIESLPLGGGGILNKPLTQGKGPVAVYKDEDGKVHQFSAICPHLHGRLCWNEGEKSFDCPIHGSRFSKEGICVIGPSERDLKPLDAEAQGIKEAAQS